MSIHELEAAGGSAHFGTNDELRIKQTVSGTQFEYVYSNGEAILISPLGGGVEMVKKQRLHYLLSFSPNLYDSRRAEINSLLDDVHDFPFFFYKASCRPYFLRLFGHGRRATACTMSKQV
jgi:hypothetical protein